MKYQVLIPYLYFWVDRMITYSKMPIKIQYKSSLDMEKILLELIINLNRNNNMLYIINIWFFTFKG